MRNLVDLDCVPCQGWEPPLSEIEVHELLPLVPAWELVQDAGCQCLKRSFKFKNFADALAFANLVGEIAEVGDHHPAILIEWGNVTVKWWTYHLKGLHRNDFIMAARTDKLVP